MSSQRSKKKKRENKKVQQRRRRDARRESTDSDREREHDSRGKRRSRPDGKRGSTDSLHQGRPGGGCGFTSRWSRRTSPFDNGTGGTVSPRTCVLCKGLEEPTAECVCQRRALQYLGADSTHVKLIAPPGWGKSIYIQCDIVRRAKKNAAQKFVIAIPRLSISKGFSRRTRFTSGETFVIRPQNNLCQNGADNGKVKDIVRWLMEPTTSDFSDRVMLASHAALSRALGQIEDLGSIGDAHFYFDEAHHLSPDCLNGTELGRQARRLLETETCGMTLTTATFLRGDGMPILPEWAEENFKEFFVPVDLHMKHNMKDLRSVGFRTLALEGDDVWPSVRDLLASGRKTIVYLPTKNQMLANGSSKKFHDKLRRQIEDEFPTRRVLSFVGSMAFQKQQMDLFLGKDMTESEHKRFLEGIDTILTIAMFDEGADWPQAELAIDLCPPRFVGRSIQRVGRLLRDGKKRCEYVSVYTGIDEQCDGNIRARISNRLNAVLAPMVTLSAQLEGTVNLRSRARTERSYLETMLPTVKDQHEFRQHLQVELRAVDPADSEQRADLRERLLSYLKARNPDAPDQTLIGAATESMLQLTRSLVKTNAKGRGCTTRKPPKITGAVRDAEQLRAQFDIVVASDSGAFFSTFPVTHAELNKLRNCLRGLNAAPLTVDWILARADEYYAAHGEWPLQASGPIDGTDETWVAVDCALRAGRRGLPGGSSLRKLLEEHRGVKPRRVTKQLTIEWVLARMDEHHGAKEEWPRTGSGPIGDTGLTWSAVNSALSDGCRGLPGGTTLAKLLTEHRDVKRPTDGSNKRPLTVEWVIAKADHYREAHGKRPTARSGPIEGAGGLTWNAVSQALVRGVRGFPGGSSLHKLLKRHGRI